MGTRTVTIRNPGANYEFRVIGDRRRPLRDLYHALMRLPWIMTFVTIAVSFLLVNAAFATTYWWIGGIANAARDRWLDAFFFSVQTMGTIGYGAMYPETVAANVLVVFESIVGLTLTALATGLVFAKFSRPTARVIFTKNVVISPMNGVPTLAFRIGNQRGNRIVNAHINVVVTRTEVTTEGHVFYRSFDLTLARPRVSSLMRSWTVLHVIDGNSPLAAETPDSARARELELQVTVVGLDDTSMQTVHASHQYFDSQILWGSRLADVLSETDDGTVLLDLTKFHDTHETEPTEGFPYPT